MREHRIDLRHDFYRHALDPNADFDKLSGQLEETAQLFNAQHKSCLISAVRKGAGPAVAGPALGGV